MTMPRTPAGRALLANLEPRFANLPWDPVSYDLTREEVLEVEAEAARAAVERVRERIENWNRPGGDVYYPYAKLIAFLDEETRHGPLHEI